LRLLNKVSGFRPKETVFEIGHKGSKGKSVAAEIMRVRRSKITIKADEPGKAVEDDSDTEDVAIPTTPSLSKQSFKDPEHYIAHFQPGNTAQEHGYDVNRPANSFAEVARGAMMNLADDDGVSLAPARPKQRWDPKKKDFVNRMNDDDGSGHKSIKMIKGESGVKIPASMKSGRYFPPKEFTNVGLNLGKKRTRRVFRRVERLRRRKISSDFRVDGSNIPRTERPRHLIDSEMIIMCKRRELQMQQNQGRKVVNYGLWIKFVRSACRLSRERRRMPDPQRGGNRAS
jgi:ATP-dependent RNA helicase DDX54/DBP10